MWYTWTNPSTCHAYVGVRVEIQHCIPICTNALFNMNSDRLVTPFEKLQCLQQAITKVVVKPVKPAEKQAVEPITADDVLSVIVFSILKAQPKSIHAHLSFIELLNFSEESTSQFGFLLASYKAAVAYIESPDFDAMLEAEGLKKLPSARSKSPQFPAVDHDSKSTENENNKKDSPPSNPSTISPSQDDIDSETSSVENEASKEPRAFVAAPSTISPLEAKEEDFGEFLQSLQ